MNLNGHECVKTKKTNQNITILLDKRRLLSHHASSHCMPLAILPFWWLLKQKLIEH